MVPSTDRDVSRHEAADANRRVVDPSEAIRVGSLVTRCSPERLGAVLSRTALAARSRLPEQPCVPKLDRVPAFALMRVRHAIVAVSVRASLSSSASSAPERTTASADSVPQERGTAWISPADAVVSRRSRAQARGCRRWRHSRMRPAAA